MPKAFVNGVNLYYEVTGKGYPLVLAHESCSDLEFWDRAVRDESVKIIMLALPSHQANLAAAAQIRKFEERSEPVLLTATAQHDDDIAALKAHGVDEAFDLHTEAGRGYADFLRDALRKSTG